MSFFTALVEGVSDELAKISDAVRSPLGETDDDVSRRQALASGSRQKIREAFGDDGIPFSSSRRRLHDATSD